MHLYTKKIYISLTWETLGETTSILIKCYLIPYVLRESIEVVFPSCIIGQSYSLSYMIQIIRAHALFMQFIIIL